MRFTAALPIICFVAFGIFVLSLAGISLLLHIAAPVNGSILTVPLAFVIGVAITAPAFLIFAVTGIILLLRPVQKVEEKEAKTAKTPKIPAEDKEKADKHVVV
jgi:uncharacterized protein (DUF58 family)